MLNIYLNKFNYYNNLNIKIKTPHHNKKIIKKIKIFYKKLKINIYFLKKQKINIYKIFFNKKYKFLANFNVINNNKTKTGILFKNNFFSFKSDLILKNYYDYYNFYNKIDFLNLNFKYYWLINIFCFVKKTNVFFFVNKIKFFINQRLVKQSILIHYTNIKKIKYSNYINLFKYNLNKNNNLVFFFKLNNFYYENNLLTENYFFKYNVFLKKFINKNNLILMLI